MVSLPTQYVHSCFDVNHPPVESDFEYAVLRQSETEDERSFKVKTTDFRLNSTLTQESPCRWQERQFKILIHHFDRSDGSAASVA